MGGSRSKIVLVLGFILIAVIGAIHTTRRQAGHGRGKGAAVSANSARTKRFKRDLNESWTNPLDLSLDLRHEKSSKNSSSRICRPKPVQSKENVDKIKSNFQAWHFSKMENSFDTFSKDNEELLRRIISLCIIMPKAGNLVNIGAEKRRLHIFIDGVDLSESTLIADLNRDEEDGDKNSMRTHTHYNVTQIHVIADEHRNISVNARPHNTPLNLRISPTNKILGLKNKEISGNPLDTRLIQLKLRQREWNFIKTERTKYRREKKLTNKDKGKESETALQSRVDSILDDIYCSQGKEVGCEKNKELESGEEQKEKPKPRQRILDATKFVTKYSMASDSEQERIVMKIMADNTKLMGNEEDVKRGNDIIECFRVIEYDQKVKRLSTSTTNVQIKPELVGKNIILGRDHVALTLATWFANHEKQPRIASDPTNFELNKVVGSVVSKDSSPVLSEHIVTALDKVILQSYDILKDPLRFWFDSASTSTKMIMMAAPLGGETSPGYSIYSLYKTAGGGLSSGKNGAVDYMVENAAEMVLTLRVGSLEDPSGSEESPSISIESTLVIHHASGVPFYKVQHRINLISPHASFRDLQHRGPSHENDSVEGIFTMRQPDYMQESVTTQMTELFPNIEDRGALLRNNDVLAGIVFPSDSTIASMTCNMEESICTLRYPLVSVPRSFEWDPADCQPHVNISCDNNGGCEIASREDAHKCYAAQSPINASMYQRHLCTCGVSATAVVPSRHQNNRIDFSDKSWVFLKRLDAKDNLTGTFRIYKCKFDATDSSDDYLCEDIQAILRRGKITPEQIMLYDLEDGDDEIQIPVGSKRINYYRITRGRKTFYGGNGTDIFDLVAPCDPLSGILHGGGGQNHLIVSPSSSYTCALKKIHINFIAGHIITGSNHQINISNLQTIKGRQRQPEIIVLSPNIKRVESGGGFADNPDEIRILQDSSTTSLPYNTTIIASGYTAIVADARNAGKIVIVTDDNDKQGNRLMVDVHAPGSGLTISTHFKNLVAQNLFVKTEHLPNNIVSVTIESQGPERSTYRFNFNFLDNLQTGSPRSVQGLNFAFFGSSLSDPTSILILNLAPSLAPLSTAFYHLLVLTSQSPEPSPPLRTFQGAKATQNIFDLLNGSWTAIGGSEDDEFILHRDIGNRSVVKGMGGNNTLMFHKSLTNESFEVDLVTGLCLNGRLQIFGVQRVIIPEGFNVSINCDCKTKAVYALGGSERAPQRVMIPRSSECGITHGEQALSLDVLAAGATQIEVQAVVNHPNRVYISIASFNQNKLSVEASVLVASGIGFTLQLNGLDWTQEVMAKYHLIHLDTLAAIVYNIKLTRTSRSDVIELKLTYPGSLGSDWYLSEPPITVEDSSGGEHNKSIFIEKETGIAKVQHLLGKDELAGEHFGYLGLPNIFLVVNGDGKTITGGNKDDVFWIQTEDFKNMLIDGGTSGVNTISFEDGGAPASGNTLTVDLASKEMYFIIADKAVVRNIQRIWGRSSLPDIIIAGCDTTDINGRGGVLGSYDNISFRISEKCSWDHVSVQVPEYTNVFNLAENGRFSYIVNDMDSSSFHLAPTKNNKHFISILQHPSKVIAALSFNKSTSKLQFKTFKTQAFHEFQMVGVENNAFKNPIIQFKSNGSGGDDVLCNLWVTTSGTIHTIFKIRKISSGIVVQGLPGNVNNFVINITERAKEPSGAIQGPPTFTKNSFVIHNLESPLELLDGNGECSENENEIKFSNEFQPTKRLIVNMKKMEHGFVRTRIQNSTYNAVIKKLKNIDVLVGRENSAFVDEVLPNCRTTSVKFFEDIKITHDPSCERDSGYNLEMFIDKKTKVAFLASTDDLRSDDDPVEGVFRYIFSTPHSFNIMGSDVVDGEHTYYLSFDITRLASLSFSEGTISYSVTQTASSETLINCSHKIIPNSGQNNPFYHQPKLVTQEGYLIQVSVAGSIFITKSSGTYSVDSDRTIKKSNIIQLLSLSTKLSVSIIAKLNDENVVYVGYASEGKKNVLQNSVKTTSHLVNNQASDTIYDIVALEQDVFIYPGFKCSTNDGQKDVMQVVDLTSIVGSIETKNASAFPFTPTIFKDDNGNDLVITMTGYETLHPGKLRIVGGAVSCFRRLKARFRKTDMSITTSAEWGDSSVVGSRKKRSTNTKWNFHPDPILIPAGYMYSIAPEDLEVGQEIRLQEEKSSNGTATTTATSFQMIKNGKDLIFTSMKSAQKRGEVESTTTVIMSRFYETSNLLTTRDDLPAGNNDTATGLGDQLLTSKKILQVTINFPSLHVILNDTKIEPIVTLGPLGGAVRVQQSASEPDTWNNLLDDVERAILRGLGDIPIKRKFETNRKRIWFRYNQA